MPANEIYLLRIERLTQRIRGQARSYTFHRLGKSRSDQNHSKAAGECLAGPYHLSRDQIPDHTRIAAPAETSPQNQVQLLVEILLNAQS